MKQFIWAFVFSFISIHSIEAVDLDVAGAKAAYERQKTISDSFYSAYLSHKSAYDQATNSVSTAQSRKNQAESNLSSENQKLVSIDSQITSYENIKLQVQKKITSNESDLATLNRELEYLYQQQQVQQSELSDIDRDLQRVSQQIDWILSHPTNDTWTCIYRDRGTEEHSGGHRATDYDKSKADADAKAVCLTFHGTCVLVRCSQPDSPELKVLYQRRDSLNRDREICVSKLNNLNNDIQYKTNKANGLQNDIHQGYGELQQLDNQIAAEYRNRERQLIAIQNAQNALSQANYELQSAITYLNSVKPGYESAKIDYETQYRETERLLAYYKQVQANYDAEKNYVYELAKKKALEHSTAEASEVASSAGDEAGFLSATLEGKAKGLRDAEKRDLVLGYLDGRKQGGSLAPLASFYQKGQDSGKKIAQEKALAESFPRGYNSALYETLHSTPTQEVTLDITEEIDFSATDENPLLDWKQKPIGSIAGPSIPLPVSPTFPLPTSPSPDISIPEVQYTHYEPPCTDLVLSEFEPLCKSWYDNFYAEYFSDRYRDLFTAAFQKSFAQTIPGAYKKFFDPQNLESFTKGQKDGAEDQGKLDGYSESLDSAHTAAFESGKRELERLLGTGHLYTVREAELSDTDGDGLLSVGESLLFSLTIDNFGEKEGLLNELRVRITNKKGVGSLSAEFRNLPPLKGKTRTHLIGVIKAEALSGFAGDTLEVQASVEVKVGETFVNLASVSAGGKIQFPLELTELKLSKDPKTNEEIDTQVVFTNRTDTILRNEELELVSDPKILAFNPAKISVSEIGPGETQSFPVKVKPGQWVGENTFVKILAKRKLEDDKIAEQAFAKFIHVDRTGSLLLFNTSGKPQADSTFTVEAGKIASFYVQFKYNRKDIRPGPFVLAHASTSDPKVTLAPGTPSGYNYGQWWPDRKADIVRFSYRFPESLKGKKVWVMLQMNEGSQWLHTPMIYFNVK